MLVEGVFKLCAMFFTPTFNIYWDKTRFGNDLSAILWCSWQTSLKHLVLSASRGGEQI